MISNLCVRRITEISGKPEGRHTFEVTKSNGELAEIRNTEVPVVRYQFGEINELNLAFISNFKQFFEFSAHVVDVFVSEGFWGEIASQTAIFDRIHGMGAAIILHLRVDDEAVENGMEEIPSEAKNLRVDRIMLDDYSTSMDVVTAARFNKKIAAEFGVQRADVGICGGPLAVAENCCITAERARAWLAKYAISKEDVIKVSSKQQDMEECGCLRHITVEDIKVKEKFNIAEYNKTHKKAGSVSKKGKETKESNGDTEKVPKKKVQEKASTGWIDMGGLF